MTETDIKDFCSFCDKLLSDRRALGMISTRLIDFIEKVPLTRQQKTEFISIMGDFRMLTSSEPYLIKKLVCAKPVTR